ncbi:MAG: zinc ribbon domain-containing protein [Dissulfurispiraceae bacterium]
MSLRQNPLLRTTSPSQRKRVSKAASKREKVRLSLEGCSWIRSTLLISSLSGNAVKPQLSHKQQWRGGIVVLVPPHTSQKCSKCGHIDAGNRPSQAVFHCQACGHTENADTNAAKNILGEGLSLLACPEKGAALIGHREPVQSDRSLKQEIRFRLVA